MITSGSCGVRLAGPALSSARRAAGVLAALLLAVVPAARADALFVRLDGSDRCDGRADRGGTRGACAFRSIARAVAVARCGDVIEIGEGAFGEEKIVVVRSCPADRPLTIRGSGRASTFWMAGLAEIDASACRAVPSGGWRCPLPPGAREQAGGFDCLVQRRAARVRFRDANGVHGDMAGPVCLTWTAPGGGLAAEGLAALDGDGVLVRTWNDIAPEPAGLWFPRTGRYQSGADGPVHVAGDGIEIRNLTIVSGAGNAVALRGARNRLDTVDVYTGSVWVDRTARDAVLAHVAIRNNYRRPAGDVAEDAWGRMRSHSLSVLATGFMLLDVETYASREGIGIAGASAGRIDGLFAHGHHNHALKFIDGAHDVTVRNTLVHNAQEPLFIECAHRLAFEHCTFPFGAVVVQENPKIDCQPRVSDLDFRDSILCGISFFDRYGDTWAGGGHDLERNVYLTDGDLCRRGGNFIKAAGRKFRSLAAWQEFADDPCRDCTRDRGSRTERGDRTFVAFAWRDDTFGNAFDFDLRPESAAIDLGASARPGSYDIEHVRRTGAEDAGAYEGGQPAWAGRDDSLRLLAEPIFDEERREEDATRRPPRER